VKNIRLKKELDKKINGKDQTLKQKRRVFVKDLLTCSFGSLVVRDFQLSVSFIGEHHVECELREQWVWIIWEISSKSECPKTLEFPEQTYFCAT